MANRSLATASIHHRLPAGRPVLKPMKRYPVLGVPVAATTYPEVVGQVAAWAQAGDRAYAVEAADVHVITRARHDPSFGEVISRFDLVTPDGMPLVWTLNRQCESAERLGERVSGAEIMAAVFEHSRSEPALSHFLLGGSPALLDELATRLGQRFSGATLADSYSPPFGEWPADEFERICDRIRTSGANLVWVGLGCPKQEEWIAAHKDRLPPAVYFGVGAAFAFHAGVVRRAPAFFRRYGLEWAYRVMMEPRRLFRRYLTYNSLFIWYSLRDRMTAET